MRRSRTAAAVVIGGQVDQAAGGTGTRLANEAHEKRPLVGHQIGGRVDLANLYVFSCIWLFG